MEPLKPHRASRILCVLAIACCASLATACSGRANGTSDKPAASIGPYYPGGLGPYSSLTGIYADKWTARRASFMVTVPDDAKRIRLRIDVPLRSFKAGQQGIVVQIGGAPPHKQLRLPLGPQVVTVAVPPSLRGKLAKVNIALLSAFIPAKSGFNGDVRELGVLLDDVSFE
jgi:hypothetical protein